MTKIAKKTITTIASRVMWLARGTSMAMGLAVMLALTAGLASTALAGTGVGAAFNLGQTNTVNAISKLVGSVTGSSLTIDNNSTASGATALDLQVESGKAPMKVNSQAKVANLNVDKLDGKDSTQVFSGDTYVRSGPFVDGAGNGAGVDTGASCDPGDVALGGGGLNIGVEDDLNNSIPQDKDTWSVEWQDNGSASTFQASVQCADFPPLR